jgi:H-type lectin domain
LRHSTTGVLLPTCSYNLTPYPWSYGWRSCSIPREPKEERVGTRVGKSSCQIFDSQAKNLGRNNGTIVPPHAHNTYGNQTGHVILTGGGTLSRLSSWIAFDSPFDEIPRIALGLERIDLGQGSSTIGVDGRVDNISSIGFTIHFETTRDAIVNQVSAVWLAVPSTIPSNAPDYQIGHFSTLDVRPRANISHTVNAKDIIFPRAFSVTPYVILWIDGFDLSITKNWRLKAYATNIAPAGFTINIDSWSDTIFYSANASWIAWPSNTKSVTGNYLKPTMVHLNTSGQDAGYGNTSHVAFPQKMRSGSVPRVLAAFNSFDVRNNGGFKIFTNSSVDAVGMDCTIASFGNTTVYSNMGVSWIAAF